MKRLVILGAGESGCGAAILGKKQGYDVFVSDSGPIAERYRAELDAIGVPYEENGHTPERIDGAEVVVKSPGIPDTAPIVRLAASSCGEVISEIEFAGRYAAGSKFICVTGSNGKTTTVHLIHSILLNAGYDCALTGNVGNSLARMVATDPHKWYVTELSSFQLDGMSGFHADIAVILNITPDHLDRYEYDMDKYTASKFGILRNQTHDDYFIYWDDDRTIRKTMAGMEFPMRLLPYTAGRDDETSRQKGHTHSPWQGAHTSGSELVAAVGQNRIAFDSHDLKIKGRHNILNSMAAILACMAAGAEEKYIRAGLEDFRGIEHRVEPVDTINDVLYINDSKGTNPDSVRYALEMADRPVVWIAGGTDKGNDYGSLRDMVKEKVRALVCLGIDNTRLRDAFDGHIPHIEETSSMEEAVRAASRIARPGEMVLLSPAAASFDLFQNYEDRGRRFKQEVAKLKEK